MNDTKENVSNVFVCVYNDNCVGLFKRKNWSSSIEKNTNFYLQYYEAGSIYVGISSDYIGMKTTHEDKHCRNRWERIGTKINLTDGSYTTNCKMSNNMMSFDDMRLTMFNNEEIGPYELGKASAEEIIKVLSYATKYYQLDQKVPKQMIK